MKKILVIVFSLLILMGAFGAAYSQNGVDAQDLTANGVVMSKDWVGQILSIQCYVDNSVDQITFYVADAAEVYKNGGSWSLTEINVGDNVTVTYHNKPNSWPVITRINING
ncbi:MAG: hypothetical protein V1650_01760 [Candidatus Omnitrophota bacterium]